MRNRNRIVRIRNAKMHDLVNYASNLTGCTYQYSFDVLCKMLSEGYVVGKSSSLVLIERILIEVSDSE